MMVHYFHTALFDVSLPGIGLFNVALRSVVTLFNDLLFDVALYHVAPF